MATLSGTITNVFNTTTPMGPLKDKDGYELRCAYLTFTISGTYVQNDNATITAVNTAIQTRVKDGRTVMTLHDVALAVPGDEAGTLIGVNTLAVSTFALTFQLTGQDPTAEHGAGAIGTINRDICLFLTYSVSLP